MPELVFESLHTKKQFKIVEFNEAEGKVTLLGTHNVPFVQEYSKELFVKWGYVLKQIDAPAAAPPPPPAVPPPPAPAS